LARKEISIVSTEDEIRVLAKKKITLNGGGSYITLDANAIEAATLGDYRTRAGFYDRQQKASAKPSFLTFPVLDASEPGTDPGESGTDEQGSEKEEPDNTQPQTPPSYNRMFNFKDENGIPYSQTKYYALINDSAESSGITDENGNTEIFSGKGIDNVRVHLAI
ncbi:DUF2345 domain-containing protein, partial [Enterobacter mori]